MNSKNLALYAMVMAGVTACEPATKTSETIIGDKKFSVLGQNIMGVETSADPVAGINSSKEHRFRESAYLLDDSAVVTFYGSVNAVAGGDKRFWRNGEFDKNEKAEFAQADSIYKLKMQ